MTANIGQNLDLAVSVPHNDQRLACQLGDEVVSALRDAAVMAKCDPVAAEQRTKLEFENVRSQVQIGWQTVTGPMLSQRSSYPADPACNMRGIGLTRDVCSAPHREFIDSRIMHNRGTPIASWSLVHSLSTVSASLPARAFAIARNRALAGVLTEQRREVGDAVGQASSARPRPPGVARQFMVAGQVSRRQ
jgi:hypothetical protein